MEFKHIVGVLSQLSWGKIAQVAVFSVIMIGFIVLWVSRGTIYDSLSIGSIPNTRTLETIYMSNRSMEETKLALSKLAHTGAISVQVINVDFKKNTRTQAFFISSNDKLKQSVDNYLVMVGGTGTPVFNSDEVNNKRIIDLLNGNFICTPYADTIGPVLYQGTSGIVEYVCSIPIPPFYGKFTGYINVYLTKAPSEANVAAIRQSLSELSIIIYEESLSIKPNKK